MANLQGLKIDRQRQSAAASGRPAVRRASFPLGSILFLGLIAALIWIFWQPLMRMADRVRLPEVEVSAVRVADAAASGAIRGTAANGTIVAARRAALSADTPGRIVEVLVEEGSVVKKGDVVARLFADEYEAALRRAEAEVEAARASERRALAEVEAAAREVERMERSAEAAVAELTSAQATQEFARREHERATRLVAEGSMPGRELESAREILDRVSAAVESSRAQVAVARAAVTGQQSQVQVATRNKELVAAQTVIAEAARDLASATLAKTEVRAPFDGVVVLKDAEVGEVVSPNSSGGSNARGSICTMVDFASLEVQVDVPESSLLAVEVGKEATIFLDASPGRPYRGLVSRIWPTANRQKATIEVRVTFIAPDEQLRPEMGVRVVFRDPRAGDTAGNGAGGDESTPGATPESALLVPENALVFQNGQEGVFVLERDVALFVALEIGARGGSNVEVKSGLRPGQRIINSPPAALASGDRVRSKSQ